MVFLAILGNRVFSNILISTGGFVRLGDNSQEFKVGNFLKGLENYKRILR